MKLAKIQAKLKEKEDARIAKELEKQKIKEQLVRYLCILPQTNFHRSYNDVRLLRPRNMPEKLQRKNDSRKKQKKRYVAWQ